LKRSRNDKKQILQLKEITLFGIEMSCVPNDPELKREIMEEAHGTTYAVHIGSTKMYKDLKEYYW